MAKKPSIPSELVPWIEARRRHSLSHAHIQMARELGMNPRKFGKINNHRQEPWKAPLPVFIESIYFKRFNKEQPDEIRSIEEIAAARVAKRQARKLAKQARKAARPTSPESPSAPSENVASAEAVSALTAGSS
jgi:hypothetical protein